MKFTLLIFFTALSLVSFSQFPVKPAPVGSPSTMGTNAGAQKINRGLILTPQVDTTAWNLLPYVKNEPYNIVSTTDGKIWQRDGTASFWRVITGGAGGNITGGPITSLPVLGFNPGTDISAGQWINNVFYASQPPLASLTGGGTFEFTNAATVGRTLSWGATRQSATSTLATIVVAGINQTFSQPAQSSTVNGTQNVTVTTNTTTNYNNLVTTTDGKSATAVTTFTYSSKYYIGYTLSSSPSDANIIAATGSTVGGFFATNFISSGTLPNPASESYLTFAFPASFGIPTIKLNGLAVAFNLTTRSFINASGFSVSYHIFVSPFPTNAGLEYEVF